jgi:hypothetical protein
MHIQEIKLIIRLSAAQQVADARQKCARTELRSRRAAVLINGYERKLEALMAGQVTPYL